MAAALPSLPTALPLPCYRNPPTPWQAHLCRSHTGRVSIDDLLALLELCRTRARHYQSFELEAQLQVGGSWDAASFNSWVGWRGAPQAVVAGDSTPWAKSPSAHPGSAPGAPLLTAKEVQALHVHTHHNAPQHSYLGKINRCSKGYCTLQMWRALSGPDGVQQFSTWICALVLESSPERRAFSRHSRQQYVGRDAVAALHAVSCNGL